MSQKLFAEELKGINLISATDKTKVKQLHKILNEASVVNGAIKTKYFAIVDGDLEPQSNKESLTSFSWSVYHIENFLLEPKYILEILKSLNIEDSQLDINVLAALEISAKNIVGSVVDAEMKTFVNSIVMDCLDWEHELVRSGVADALHRATVRSFDRIGSAAQSKLNIDILRKKEQEISDKYHAAFIDGSWIRILPGREILTNFVSLHARNFKYIQFRNMIINHMVRDKFKPLEMFEKFSFIQNATIS